MFLGNIVSEQPIKENKLFNHTNNIENIDREIPTLIIGWDFSKRIYIGTKLSILDKNINNKISWTFTKKEKRYDYDKDLKNFINNSLKEVENTVNYKYINILTDKFNTFKKIINKLTSTEKCYIYIYKNSFIYALIGGIVIGIDLNTIDYLDINRKRIYNILYKGNNDIFFSDDFLDKEIRMNINNKQKIIPYLYAIQHKK